MDKKVTSAIIISAILLLPAFAQALALAPKGAMPVNPPLQAHSPLVKPNISKNISSSSSPAAGQAAVTAPTEQPPSPANSQNPPAVSANPVYPTQQPGSFSWGKLWLWLLFVVLGSGAGYWLINKKNGKN